MPTRHDILRAVPSPQEIWNEVCDIPIDCEPGKDGFTGQLFQSCWDIVKADVIKMVQGFFQKL